MNLKRDTYAIVNLDHLKYNVELAHEKFKRPLMAVIKADAYGHGYREVASFLKDIDYIDGANHGYDEKEELLAIQIIDFIKNI